MSASRNFHINLNHFAYGIRATPSTPISTPDVGVIILVKPSPNWKASTVNWRETPIMSDHSAIIGIVRESEKHKEIIKKFYSEM